MPKPTFGGPSSHPLQDRTGSLGYFGKSGLSKLSWHKVKRLPLALSMMRQWRHLSHRPEVVALEG